MPPLTNTQQALGIGGSKPTTAQQFAGALGGGSGMNPWQSTVQGTMPRGTGLTPPAWSPQIMRAGRTNTGPSLAAMYQGLNPGGPPGSIPPDTRNPGGGLGVNAPPRAKPTAPPSTASQLNSMAPGYFNGNQTNGTPAPFKPMGSLPATAQPPQPSQQMTTMQQALVAPTGAEASQGIAGSTREAAAGPLQMRAADATGVPAENGPTGPVATFTGTNGANIPLTAQLPKNWASMKWADRKAWLDSHTWTPTPAPGGGGTTTPPTGTGNYPGQTNTTPGGTTGTGTTTTPTMDPGAAADALSTTTGGGDSADPNYKAATPFRWGNNLDAKGLETFFQTNPNWGVNFGVRGLGLDAKQAQKIGVENMPSVNTYGEKYIGGPITGISLPQTLWDPFSPQYIKNDSVRNLLSYSRNLAAQINQLSTDGGESTSEKTATIQDLYQKLGVSRMALNQYGIQYDPFAIGQDAGGTRPQPGEPGYDPYAINVEYPQLGSNTLLPKDLQAMLGIGSGMAAQDRMAATEFAYGLYNDEDARYNKQKAINELVSMKGRIADDPNRLVAQSIANSLGDYNLTDPEFQMVKNQTAGNYAKGLDTIRSSLSGAAASTGMDPSAYAGSYAESAIGNRQGLADRLGQMDVERAAERRANRLTNLDVRRQLSGQYTGADSAASMAIANALRGAAELGPNPMQGLGANAANLYSIQLQHDANEQSQKAAEDAAQWGQITDIVGLFASGMGGGGFGR